MDHCVSRYIRTSTARKMRNSCKTSGCSDGSTYRRPYRMTWRSGAHCSRATSSSHPARCGACSASSSMGIAKIVVVSRGLDGISGSGVKTSTITTVRTATDGVAPGGTGGCGSTSCVIPCSVRTDRRIWSRARRTLFHCVSDVSNACAASSSHRCRRVSRSTNASAGVCTMRARASRRDPTCSGSIWPIADTWVCCLCTSAAFMMEARHQSASTHHVGMARRARFGRVYGPG